MQKLAAKPPAEYIAELHISPDRLRESTVPDAFVQALETGTEGLDSQWDVSRYDDFVAERAEDLAQQATMFLSGLEEGNVSVPRDLVEAKTG